MNRRRGQGLVEFALVMPILLFMIMGIFDFSRLFITYAVTSNSLRTALRLAEVRGSNANDPEYANCGAMRAIANNVVFANAPTVTIFYRKANAPTTTYTCNTSKYTPISNIDTGDMLNISVDTTVRFITPIISNLWPTISLRMSGQRTIVREIQMGSVASAASDSDYDGLDDAWELANFGNLNQTATDDPDGDGCNNGCEQAHLTNPNNPDTDGDGVPDGQEVDCNLDPNSASTTDGDGDGLTANLECQLALDDGIADFDGDGLLDGYEYHTSHTDPKKSDTDGDGLTDGAEVNTHLTNPLAKDTDGDGLWDGAEITRGTNPNDYDTDEDGLLDGEEVGYSDGSFVSLGTNPLNPDSDGDGLGDGWEHLNSHTNPNLKDTDADGLDDDKEIFFYLTDPLEADTDCEDAARCDHIKDGEEINGTYNSPACGFVLPPSDPLNWDTDGDGIADDVDCVNANDSDGDGLLDTWEILHFLTITTHTGTDDPDNDLCNNLCEQMRGLNPLHADTDGDGLSDGQEALASVTGYTGTNPNNWDTDGDGVGDGVEVNLGFNPFVLDSDGDGLNDGQEYGTATGPGGPYTGGTGTDPDDPDTDDDGLNDGEEVNFASRNYRTRINNVDGPIIPGPLDPLDTDMDNDGLSDGWEIYWQTDPFEDDSDGDGLLDGNELMNGDTNPALMDSDDTNPALTDTDGDGLNDGQEFLTYHTDPRMADSDGDGLDDYREVNFGAEGYTVTVVKQSADRLGTTVVTTVNQNLDPMDTDTDNDGASDGDEVLQMLSNPHDTDSDDDGLDDSDERVNGTNPIHWDSDGDKWGDLEELTFGSSGYQVTVTRQVGGTTTYPVTNNLNPTSNDSDGDGLNDWDETHFSERNYSVTVNAATTTTTPITANLDPTVYDTDLDGVNDGPEVTNLTNPLHWDTDGDVYGDSVDAAYPLDWPMLTLACQDPANCTRAEVSNSGSGANRYITFRIAATRASAGQNVQASYATAGVDAIGKAGTCGPAGDNGDFLDNSGVAIFNGVGNQDVQVRICRQVNGEADETFNFTITPTGPNQAVTVAPGPNTRTATITNLNNPTLTVTCPSNPGCTITSSTSGSTTLTFRISASDLDTSPISVTIDTLGSTQTGGGTARRGSCSTSGRDFSRPGTLTQTINNGSYWDVPVTICRRGTGDAATETLIFTTTSSATDVLLPGNVTGTIQN